MAVEDEVCPDGTEDCVLDAELGEVGEDFVWSPVGCFGFGGWGWIWRLFVGSIAGGSTDMCTIGG